PILGMVIAAGLIYFLHTETKIAFVIWLVIGLIIYFSYSRHNSQVQRARAAPTGSAPVETGAD
ncbi:MAG: amino acid permease C-terminal domain-containing protein, partial [Terriglobales bacterium]